MPGRLRARAAYLALALGTIAVGLAVHLGGEALGRTTRDVVGDALWATMVAWWVGAVAPGAGLRTRAAIALGLCFAVEVSQLHHAAALDALRATRAGHLVLGSGFDPRDLAAYAAGVAAAVLLERAVIRRRRRRAAVPELATPPSPPRSAPG
ncbi:Protein of unknown function [bacterium JGI 053]|nr:Protein of unknown function [bacterium JGI 053]